MRTLLAVLLCLGSYSVSANPGDTPWLRTLKHGERFNYDGQGLCVREVWTNIMWGQITVLYRDIDPAQPCTKKHVDVYSCLLEKRKCVYCTPGDHANCEHLDDIRTFQVCADGSFVMDGKAHTPVGAAVTSCAPVGFP
jgi:hypothetical protein